MPGLVSGFPEATPACTPLRSRTGETAFTPRLPVQADLGDIVGWVPGHYNIASITVKGVIQIFWFPSAYRSYIYPVLSPVKCAVALCLKKTMYVP